MKIFVQFGKTDRLRFISHLDLQRFMQMALRRTELPVAYSKGFNPHPLISFASALAMGWTSEYEILDVRLDGEVDPEAALFDMKRSLPPGLPVYDVRAAEDQHPALMALLYSAGYIIHIPKSCPVDVEAALAGFMARDEVIALRKTKSGEKPTDIRPMVLRANVASNAECTEILCTLMLTERSTLKPDLLIKTLLGEEVPDWSAIRIHRTRLYAQDKDGSLIPLMEA